MVFSEQALEFLRADDPETVDAITPRMESWSNITLNLRGESVEIDGVGFSSIGRLELLSILQQRVRAGRRCAAIRHDDPVGGQLEGYDLIVAADGLNSLVRRSFERRVRRLGVPFDQQVRLVRHHQALCHAVADLCEDRARRRSTRITTAIRPT